MAVVMIKCPLTLHAVSTEIKIESDAGFHCLPDITYHLRCPLCGNTHSWTKLDAWIAESPESVPEPIPPGHAQMTDYSSILKRGWLQH
jgi:hypothetical protein